MNEPRKISTDRELQATLRLGRDNGLEAALTVVGNRIRSYRAARERRGHPVGIVETELSRIASDINAARGAG